MTDFQFKIVDRPITIGEGDPIIVALMETAETGKAVSVPLSTGELAGWTAKIRYTLRDLGFKLAYRTDKNNQAVICWAIKQPDETE